MTNESDALLIARWCWPEDLSEGWAWIADGTYTLALFDPDSADNHDQALHGVSDAERVLIKRGHADAYGRELCSLIRAPGNVYGHNWAMSGEQCAELATAPLDARVRAMASVIRALEAQ